jgi:uncharacterized protein
MHQSLPRTIDYVEMSSSDLTATKNFFTGLFGWSFQEYGPEYAAFDDGRMTGGFFAAEKTWNAESAGPLVVFYSPELEPILADVQRLGGEVTRDIFEFPGGRRFHFAAPGSGEFAIWSEK